MMKGGLMGAGIGAVTGFAVGYTYTAGWQNVLHGADTAGHNNQYMQQLKKVYSNLTVSVQEQLKSTQSVFGKGYGLNVQNIDWQQTGSDALTYFQEDLFCNTPQDKIDEIIYGLSIIEYALAYFGI